MSNNITTNYNLELSQLLIENISNKQTFDQLLLNGANINIQNINGWCALFEFIYLHLNDNIYEYYKKGMDINIRDENGRNALFWAIYVNNFDAVKLLLSLGINLTVSIKNKLHAFHYMISKNNLAFFKELTKIGMSINEKDAILSTPLIYAVLYGKVEIVNYLIDNDADKFFVDSLGNCAYSLAKELEVKSIIKKLEG